MTQRIIAIGLDGFEPSVAMALIAQGDLPHLRKLLEESATFQLDHGDARYTGLAWEHFSTGHGPDGTRRWSAVDFEPSTYSIVQKTTRHEPFTAKLQKRVLAFDVPYHELAGNVCGLASWGAHDPGIHRHSQPDGLTQEIESRFGGYPAKQFIYGHVWPDAARTAQMGHALGEALKLRSRIAQWLMSERLPDWDLAIVVASEFHSALEAMWHGWDSAHPLHNVPSAAPAREGIVRLYRTLDVMVKELRERYPDAVLCLFSPHGMGENTSDLPAMALVPELMFRHAFHKPLLRAYPSATGDAGIPPLSHPESWSRSVLPYFSAAPGASGKGWAKLRKWFGGRGAHHARTPAGAAEDLPLDWMPASRYQPFWRDMRAFALPSFYDARIRINLKGREAAGLVERADYESELDRIEQLIGELRDSRTNEPVATKLTRPVADDPFGAEKSHCDLRIVWPESVCGFIHPRLGKIGPLPMRRTGGHTGGYGLAAFANTRAKPGDHGVRSTFDLVPTLVHLLGEEKLARELNGNFLL